MNHYDDDILLKFVLEILDEQETTEVKDHISQCEQCQQRLEDIRKQTELIGNLDLDIKAPEIPLPTTKRIPMIRFLRAAAMILIGFSVGFGMAKMSSKEQVNIIPQRFQVTAAPDTFMFYRVCEPVDLHWFRISTTPDSIDA